MVAAVVPVVAITETSVVEVVVTKVEVDSLVELAVEARKHGMSYGQYVAWKGL